MTWNSKLSSQCVTSSHRHFTLDLGTFIIIVIDAQDKTVLLKACLLAMFLMSRGLGMNAFFSWYEYSVSIELKMGHVI